MVEIGTCLTVIVVPDGIFLVKFLFGMPDADAIGDDFTVEDKVEIRLPPTFLVKVVCPCCRDVSLDVFVLDWFPGDFGGDDEGDFFKS